MYGSGEQIIDYTVELLQEETSSSIGAGQDYAGVTGPSSEWPGLELVAVGSGRVDLCRTQCRLTGLRGKQERNIGQ